MSSYQGGHMEYFRYLVDRLRAEGRGDISVYGGGGGVIVPSEIEELEAYGVRRIFSPSDGQRLGLDHMINLLIEECDRDLAADPRPRWRRWRPAISAPWPAGSPASRPAPSIRPVSMPSGPVADRRPAPVLGHHRYRRLGEVVADRRDHPPVPARPGGQAVHRRPGRRPHPAPGRGRAARGPHPDERHRRPQRLLPLPGHPGGRLRASRPVPPGRGGLRRGRIRPGHRGDARHRPGRRRRHRHRRCLPLRDDPGVRRRLPAREDRHAGAGRRGGHQQVRPTGCRRRLPPGVPAVGAGPPAPGPATEVRSRCSAPSPPGSTTTASPPCSTVSKPSCRPRGWWPPMGCCPRWPAVGRPRHRRSSPPTGAGTWPRSPRPWPATTPPPTGWSPRPAGPSRWPPCWPRPTRRGVDTGDLGGLAAAVGERTVTPKGGACSRSGSGLRAALAFDGQDADGPTDPADETGRPARWRTSLSGTRIPRVALPRFTEHGELVRWLRAEHLPGHFPFTAGVFPFKREGEDPARMFAGEGDAVPDQPPLPPAGRGPAGHPAVHGLRLGDPVRVRPRRASGHLRQGRDVRCLHRHPRRHEGPLRRVRPLRSDHLGVHDHQRSGPDHPGHVPQHGHRPAHRPSRVRAGPPGHSGRGRQRSRPRCSARCGARCRPTS